MRTILTLALLALLVGAPLAAAQNDTANDGDRDGDVIVNPPDNVDIDVTDEDGDPEESTVAGWSTTTVLVLVVVAVLLVALIAIAASRDRW